MFDVKMTMAIIGLFICITTLILLVTTTKEKQDYEDCMKLCNSAYEAFEKCEYECKKIEIKKHVNN